MNRARAFAAISTLTLACAALAMPTFQAGAQTGLLPSALTEASGIVASRSHANVLWSHNDSGNAPVAYAMTPSGNLLGSYTLGGTTNTDWEDIAMAPNPAGGSYLYMGDIGDNNANRTNIKVYRVAEPSVFASQNPVTTTLSGVTTFTFTYEDGARDAESLIVDPLDGSFYVITKREAQSRVYRCASPSATGTNTLTRVATLNFNGATGADISPDGMHILIRRYSAAEGTAAPASTAASYYTRLPGESFVDALTRGAEIVPLRQEFQGEAIGFAGDGNGFYTTSEKTTTATPPIYYYALLPEPSAMGLLILPLAALRRRK